MLNYRLVLVFLISVAFLPAAHGADDYVLGPGDTIRISVYGHSDLTTEGRITGGGKITFPLIGEMAVGGKTLHQAETEIAQALSQGGFLKSPQVNINVQDYKSKQVSVIGKVNKPGKYAIDSGQSVVDLIAMAGGVATDGDDNIVVVKNGKDGRKEHVVNLNSVLQGGDKPQSIDLADGDIIFVPRMEMFYIYGQVQKPGSYRLERGMTVMQALSVAEGLTDKGTERGLKINRRNSNGEMQTLNASVTDTLQPNDVVYVKESLF